jgi:cell division septum initiation protein DivIVA
MLQQSKPKTLATEIHSSILDDSPQDKLHNRLVEAELKPTKVDTPSVFAAIDRLEETILNSPRLPLTGKTMVNEEDLLEQLDLIRLNLPKVVATAQEILQSKDRLVRAAQQQVQQILAEANQHAYQVANEMGIVERSEQEARQIRQTAIAECEYLRQQAIIEVKRVRDRNIDEIDEMRTQVAIECEEIQAGADEYADRVLHDMEYQLSDILQAIQRGRQRLNTEGHSQPSEPELTDRVDDSK